MKIVKRLARVLIIVLALIVGASSAAVIVSQTAWFKNWLRGFIVREAQQYVNGTLSIERLGGNLFFGVEMENIGLSIDGSQVVAVKDLGLDYNVFHLIANGLSIDTIRLDQPMIYLRRDGDTWQLSRLVKKQKTEADRSGPAKPITIDAIVINGGSVVFQSPAGISGVDVPKRFDHLDATLSFKYEAVRYSLDVARLSFRGSDPELALNELSGGLSVRDDTVFVDKLALKTAETSLSVAGAVQHYLGDPIFNLEISSDKLSLPEIARVVPALAGVNLQPSFNVKTAGPLDRLGLEMNVQSSAGLLSGKVVADLMAPGQSVAGDVSVQHLDLSPILHDPRQKSDITADAHVDVRGEALSNVNGLKGTLSIDSPRLVAAGYVAERVHAKANIDGRRVALDGSASAYHAAATVAGHVTLPEGKEPLAYDLHGRAQHLDLRQLPRDLNVPPAATDVNADYHVVSPATQAMDRTDTVGTPRATSGIVIRARASKPVDASVGTSLSADLHFLASTVAGARIAAGSTAGATVTGKDVAYRVDADVADLDLQQVGEQFKVPALATDQYASSINGHITATGRGTTPQEADLTAKGTLTDSKVMGGRIPALDFDAALARDTAHVKATGGFAGFDPGVASGRPQLKGTVDGTLDVDATIVNVSRGVTPDSVQADGMVTLQPSTIGGLEITRANVDGAYRNAAGEIRALEIVGRDVNVQGSGTLALNDTGQSNLTLHADSPSLAEIGKLVDQPITGIGKIDVTVTGNKQQLQAIGTVVGDGVKYGDNGALSVSSDFTAKVPQLTIEDTDVTATTHATFVTVAGQNLNELDAKTTYKQKRVDFDATAKQPQRTLGAAGALVLHPDHQEVHLQQLGLQTQGQTWQLASGSQATINYANNVVSVDQVTLTNGDQQIGANGVYGRTGDAVKVTLTNVDLAGVDALLLRPPQFTGRLDGSATITADADEGAGSAGTPQVKADFQINKGGFRQFHYDTLSGTVDYAGPGLTLNAKLQQNPTTWVEAKGYVPVAAFKLAQETGGHAHHDGAAKENSFDLHVDSSPIDLGIVQGFTSMLTNVTGTIQAKLDVTGAADDPHPSGEITVQNGAFKVDPTGVAYTGLDGRIDLQSDKIHIDQIRVLDNQKKPLTVSGDLDIHEQTVGGVSIAMKTDDFKVIDNNLGNLRITSNMRLTGELTAPRIEGDLGVETGKVDLDQIMALVGDSAYSTEQTEYLIGKDASAATPAPSTFDALQIEVHLTVPNDLVIKANDLKAPGAVIGLGALNLTMGGDLWISKTPWDQIRLVGVVNTVRGTYDFQGRRFTILRDGTVKFEGTDDLDPALDIRTERVIQAVTANVSVRGTLKNPTIELSSTPPLEQADILSLIVFNQPINQLGEGQQTSLVQRAQQMATGAVAGELAQSIGNALGLDTFQISTAPDSGAAAQLTVGQQLGQNLYVSVQQDVGDQSQTNFILEYELTKWLRLRTNVLQGSSTQQQLFQRMQGSGVDLLFFFSY
jgi:autotransporter translocation and assembly factor TamB